MFFHVEGVLLPSKMANSKDLCVIKIRVSEKIMFSPENWINLQFRQRRISCRCCPGCKNEGVLTKRINKESADELSELLII